MKTYVHARLPRRERALLDDLKASTGHSESALVRRGLSLLRQELARAESALDLAGSSVGKFTNGPKDLTTDRRHLDGFGE